MKLHELKCWPEYFAAIVAGRKRFEIRRRDPGVQNTPPRGFPSGPVWIREPEPEFEVGDYLALREWAPPRSGTLGSYTGRLTLQRVLYVEESGQWLPDSTIRVLSIEPFWPDEGPLGTLQDDEVLIRDLRAQTFHWKPSRALTVRDLRDRGFDVHRRLPLCK